ncbi:MAG: hypothetical protein ACI83I_002747 [Bacteroidia bacterium]|jgi:hypothetical protein
MKVKIGRRFLALAACLLSVLFFWGCKDDLVVENLPPDSHISIEKIDLHGQNRLNSSVYLSWYGTDRDGYVVGYEYSLDGTTWKFTERRDSVFRFSIDAGLDTSDISFYLRAIDDHGVKDPTPALLIIPLKNSPPEANFEEKSFPTDTAYSVVTFRWNYKDPDGNHTVTKAFLKVNEGEWFELDRSKILISLRAEDTKLLGTSKADLFYDTDLNKVGSIDGFNNGGSNVFYLKVVDIAGTESKVDTSSNLFVKHQTSDLLLIGGQPAGINALYKNFVSKSYGNVDAVDFADDQGQYQPIFWNPTFSLLTEKYDKLVFNCDQSLFTNRLSGQSGLLLEFAAQVLQNYTNKGGKSFISTSFPAGFDPSLIRGALPVDSLSRTSGQATVVNDSFIYSFQAGLPSLQPSNLVLGLDPFVKTADAFPYYFAQITRFGAWKGTNVVGVRRTNNGKVDGKTNQVFFSTELHLYNKDQAKLQQLFNHVINTELNW